MSNRANACTAEYPETDLKALLQSASGSLDPETHKRLLAGIDRMLEENRQLCVRADRAEAERDSLLNAADLQEIVYDANGRVVRANSTAFLGRGADLIGMDMQAVIERFSIRHTDGRAVHPEEMPGYRALRGTAVAGERLDIRARSGREVNVMASAAPIFQNGIPSGAVTIWEDATEQEQMRRGLKETDTLLDGLFESLGGIVAIQRPDHTIVRYNKACYELLGMTPEEVNGKKCYELIGRNLPCEVCATRQAVESGKHQVIEKHVPELGDRYLECHSSPIVNEDGEVILVIEQLHDITDRKRAEEALKESEHFARQLAESAPVALFIYDIDRMTVVYVNPAFESLLGYRLEEIQAMGPEAQVRIYHPEDAARWLDSDRQLYQDREDRVYEGEYRVITPDGRTLWALVRERVFSRHPDGSPREIFAIAQDITARKAAEEALKESEERSRSIFATSHAVMLIVDPDSGAIADANPAASAYYGYPHEVLTSKNIADINTLGRDETLAELRKSLTGRKNYFAFRHRLANGEVRDVDVYSGEVIIRGRSLLHSIIHDVTCRKQAEKALQALLNAMTDASSLIDRDGMLLALNDVLAEFLGGTVEDFFGKCVYDHLPEGIAGNRKSRVQEVLSTGRPLRFIDEHAGKMYANTLFPVRGGDGDVERVAMIARDITRQKQLEKAWLQAFEQIEHNIEQFAILADHIRQPLQVVLGMAELSDDPQIIDAIRREVGRINGYIKQLDQGWMESREVRAFLRRHEPV